jgi:hypothetical protein
LVFGGVFVLCSVIIPIIQPGYSGYSSTVLPITRLLKPPI